MDNMTQTSDPRPATEVMRDVTESSRELFASGERVMRNLEELQDRAEAATDWRAQVTSHPIMMLGLAFAGGLLLARLLPDRH
jgi:hypothetical protein